MNSKAVQAKKQKAAKAIGDRAMDAVIKFEKKHKNDPKIVADVKEIITLQGDWQWTAIINILAKLGENMNLVFSLEDLHQLKKRKKA